MKILNDLEKVQNSSVSDGIREWATKTIATLRERSPLAISVTLRALREGKKWHTAQAFQNDYAIASVFMAHPDFVTGVRARLIDRIKTRPNWTLNRLEDVKETDVDKFFEGCNAVSGALNLTGSEIDIQHSTYNEYPHGWTALPSEREILATLHGYNIWGGDLKQEIMSRMQSKTGLWEKVQDVYERFGALRPSISKHTSV